MTLLGFKINSSVIIASIAALITSAANTLSDGAIINTIVDVVAYFLNEPDTFKPYLTERLYQFLLTFLPVLIIILRNTNVRGLPPIERIKDDKTTKG